MIKLFKNYGFNSLSKRVSFNTSGYFINENKDVKNTPRVADKIVWINIFN